MILTSLTIGGCSQDVPPVSTEKSIASADSSTVPKEFDSQQRPTVNRKLLFSCMTENGQEILLFETDETIDYSFGKPGKKPELNLKVPRNRASTWQWKGMGRVENYWVEIPHEDLSYQVVWERDRLSEKNEINAGVAVRRDQKTITASYCKGKIVNNLQGVKLKTKD